VLADDDPRWKRDPVAQARAACAGGAAVVQLRAKHATDREALGWCEAIRAVTREAGTLFFVNDRFDLALAAGADGVHLGQGDLPPDRIPTLAREQLLIGRSSHDAEQARRAKREPIDYLAFGPVFGTTSKRSEYSERGLASLREIAASVTPCPLVAIGGIDQDRVAEVILAGAAAAAVISAVAGAADPVAATRALVAAIEEVRA
jgi:thiamine-phosphate pyrophosphorylase